MQSRGPEYRRSAVEVAYWVNKRDLMCQVCFNGVVIKLTVELAMALTSTEPPSVAPYLNPIKLSFWIFWRTRLERTAEA